jgi:hypothetical protein
MQTRSREAFAIAPVDADSLVIRRGDADGPALLCLVRLRSAGPVDAGTMPEAAAPASHAWRVACTSEDGAFASDAQPTRMTTPLAAAFARPGVVILESHPAAGSGAS